MGLLWGFIFLFAIGNLTALSNPNIPLINRVFPQGISFIFLLLILSSPAIDFRQISVSYIKIFVVANASSILIWIALTINVSMPYEMIHLGGRDHLNYRNYFNLAIFCDWTVYSYPNFTISRNGGLFEEPGMFGTLSALLAALSIITNAPRKYFVILLSYGLSTLSLAFFLLCVPIFIYFLFSEKIVKNLNLVAGTLLVILSALPILSGGLLYRLGRGGNMLGNSRVSDIEKVGSLFEPTRSTTQILFGSGIGSNKYDALGGFSGLGSVVLEFGVVGTILLLFFLFYHFIFRQFMYRRLHVFLFCLPALSIFQRYDFVSAALCLFWVSAVTIGSERWQRKSRKR